MQLHWDEKSHLDDFVRLNNDWIEKYFQLEDFDRALAKDPAAILREGGHVLSVTDDEQVIGVCALLKESSDVFELARMAVCQSRQGKGVGTLILREVMKFSEENGIYRLFLVSNTTLKSAIHLYEKFGFNTAYKGQHPTYQRANIVMEKSMINDNKDELESAD